MNTTQRSPEIICGLQSGVMVLLLQTRLVVICRARQIVMEAGRPFYTRSTAITDGAHSPGSLVGGSSLEMTSYQKSQFKSSRAVLLQRQCCRVWETAFNKLVWQKTQPLDMSKIRKLTFPEDLKPHSIYPLFCYSNIRARKKEHNNTN